MDEATLEAVVRRAQAGEAEAFAGLYRHFYRRVLGLCRRLLGSTEAAEDAASEVFIRARRGIGGVDPALPFPRWLLSIASHYCLDQLRHRHLEERMFEPDLPEWHGPETPGLSPLGQLLAEEQRGALRAALEALPRRTRLSLVLRYESEFSYDQIAAAMGLNRNHVATLIFRGKKELRRVLERASEERRQ